MPFPLTKLVDGREPSGEETDGDEEQRVGQEGVDGQDGDWREGGGVRGAFQQR